ncbi:MAG: sulfite exporter TauE/SafE family protein [Bacteroidota bacterium]
MMSNLLELPPELQLSWSGWLLALLAVSIVGLSKAGIKGLGVFFVTTMAYVYGSKASTGIVLPLLITADIFAVIYYNRHAQWSYIFRLLPWVILGVLIATLVGKDLPEAIFKQGMALIILVSVGLMFWWERKTEKVVPKNIWFTGIMGFLVGFTTMIGNLAGPVANIFFLSTRLPKTAFIGTAAWLFFIVNIFKMPFHIFSWGTITADTLALNLRLIPGIAIGLFVGIRLVNLIQEQHYRQLILVLTGIGALILLLR